MKTIQVNGETWEKKESNIPIINGNYLVLDDLMYIPQKKEITLDEIRDTSSGYHLSGLNKKNINKLAAIRDMILVADYLNEGWEPDWESRMTDKWTFEVDEDGNIMTSSYHIKCSICYIKDEETAERAIKILGEETIKTALS